MRDAETGPSSEALQGLFQAFDDVERLLGDSLGIDSLMVLLRLLDGPDTAGCLSAALQYSPAKTTRCLRRPIELGLVEEGLVPDDMRICRFSLTNKGRNVVFEIARSVGNRSLEKLLERFVGLRRAAIAAQACGLGRRLGNAAQRVLLVLRAHGGPMTVGELSEASVLPQSTVSMALRGMDGAGLVEARRSELDGRCRSVELTAHGEKTAACMLSCIKDLLDQE